MNDLSKARATTLEVGEDAAAQRIDNFLFRHLKGVPKSHVYRVLRSGEVRVNSGRVKPEYRLQPGDRVRVPPIRISQGQKTKARPAEFPLAHEDGALLVVDKPAGVAVHAVDRLGLEPRKPQRGVGRALAVQGALVDARRRRLEGEPEPLEERPAILRGGREREPPRLRPYCAIHLFQRVFPKK